MTSSEIADKLDYAAGVYGDSGLSQAASTIRAQAEALKIATEALERIGHNRAIDFMRQALARNKEVGA